MVLTQKTLKKNMETLLECENILESYGDYKDCLTRKASFLVDRATGMGMTQEQLFHVMDVLTIVTEAAKKLVASSL